jgi:hypothetical protein
MNNPFARKKKGGSLATASYGSQVEALIQQKAAQQGGMVQAGGNGQMIDLYPQAVGGNPGAVVHSPSYVPVPYQQNQSQPSYIPISQPITQQSSEVYIPMSQMQHQSGQGGQPPIIYTTSSAPPESPRQDVWIPVLTHFNAWKYNPNNPDRLMHMLWGCVTSWVYKPRGSAESVVKIVVVGVGVFFTCVGVFSACTNQTKTITIGPPQSNPGQILTPIRDSLPTVDIR